MLRLALPNGRTRIVARARFRTDLDRYASFLSPTIVGDRLTFGLQRISGLTGGARPARSTEAAVITYRIASRRSATRTVSPFLVSVAPAGDAFVYGTSADGDAWLAPIGSIERIP